LSSQVLERHLSDEHNMRDDHNIPPKPSSILRKEVQNVILRQLILRQG